MADSTKGQVMELIRMGLDGRMPPRQWMECLEQVASGLSREGLQVVISGGEPSRLRRSAESDLKQDLMDLMETSATASGAAPVSTDELTNEEVRSTYDYPAGWSLRSPTGQAMMLHHFFPFLNVSHVERLASGMEVPAGFDGIGVIPKLSVLATRDDDTGHRAWPVLNRALDTFLPVMGRVRQDFHNYMEDNIGPEHLRLWNGTQEILTTLEAETPGDCLVIPVQTGLRHRGKSPRRARVVFTPETEFGLDPVSVGCLILTHPERLQTENELWIDCSGAEHFRDGVWTNVPNWGWGDGELRLGWVWSSHAREDFGSASLWRPGVLAQVPVVSASPSSVRGASASSAPANKKKSPLLEF